MLFVAVREGVHVGVVEQRVVAVPPRELLREETKCEENVSKIAFDCLRLQGGFLSGPPLNLLSVGG